MSNTAMTQHQTGSHPISLVCVAAPPDSALLDQWEVHLLPLTQAGAVTVWSEHHLLAGANRREELFAHLEQATCLVLLLSADFFACEECRTLMERGLQRHREKNVAIIPLLVRPVAWQDSPLAMLPCLPANGVAITTWEYPDEGWLNAVQGVRRLLGRAGRLSSQVPLGKRASTNRERMLHRLCRIYQASLGNSLQEIVWMELGLAEHPDAVRNAVHLLQRLPNRTEQAIPAGTSILSAYDQAEEELLILGAPGAGKSTLLLDLALHLTARAEDDETHPLPVIVPLSSWAVSREKLADWLVEQLARIYSVPRKLGQAWIEQGRVLPLLDGLDEMEEATRPLCITAINAYRAERMTPLVVCSRKAEYDVASTQERLILQNAIVVQPFTQQQVEHIVDQGGEVLAALREAFIGNPTVRELATTPLMLSMLILAYRGTTISDLPQQQTRLEERIWTDYVGRMVLQKGSDRPSRADRPEKRYPLEQTCSWLSWLARQMQGHNQTIFFLERLQPDWLPKKPRVVYRWSAGLVSGLLFGLGFWLLYGLLGGLFGGLYLGLLVGLSSEIELMEALTWSWEGMVVGLVSGLLVGLGFWLLGSGWSWPLPRLFGSGWSSRLLGGLSGRSGQQLTEHLMRSPNEGLQQSITKGLVVGLGLGLGGGLLFGLLGGLSGRSEQQLTEHLMRSPNEGIQRSITNGLVVGLVSGLLFGLGFGLLLGLSAGLLGGLSAGLLLGLGGLGPAIQHYTLRFWLSRTHMFPWKTVPFLEDATTRILLRRVGRGYSFPHRLLLDYFADLNTRPTASPIPSSTPASSPPTGLPSTEKKES